MLLCRSLNAEPSGNIGVAQSTDLRISRLGVISILVDTLFSVQDTRRSPVEEPGPRHQISVLRRSVKKRPKLSSADWFFRVSLCSDWRSALVIV